jgi:hypothetical protein
VPINVQQSIKPAEPSAVSSLASTVSFTSGSLVSEACVEISSTSAGLTGLASTGAGTARVSTEEVLQQLNLWIKKENELSYAIK